MRFLATLAAVLLAAGCMGAPAPKATVAAPAVAPPAMVLLVTNDEIVPIPGAIAFLDDRPEPAHGNEFGEVHFQNVSEGAHKVRLWAPDHYRAAFNITFNASEERPINLFLERRAPDHIRPVWTFVNGLCFVALRTGQGIGDSGCMAEPRVSSSPPTFFDVPLFLRLYPTVTERFENTTIRFAWGQAPVEQVPVLEARLVPDGTFPNGQKVLKFSGRGPFLLEFQARDLDPALLQGDHRIRIGPTPADDGQARFLFRLPFHADIWTGTRFQAPPNDPWTA